MPPVYQPPVPFSPNVNTTPYPAGAPFAGYQFVSVTITSAQILALNSTPVVVIPAPASTQVIVPHYAVIRYNYGGVAYAGTVGALQLRIGTLAPLAPTLTTLNTANVGVTASSVEMVSLSTAAVSSAPPPTTTVAGTALFVLLTSANATTGTGTLDITVYYTTENAA